MRQRPESSIRLERRWAHAIRVKCECGWTAQGTEDELIQLTQQHGREVHKLEVTPEQARAQFRPIEG